MLKTRALVRRTTDAAHVVAGAGSRAQRSGPGLPGTQDRPSQSRARLPGEVAEAEIETILRGVWDNLGRVARRIRPSRPAVGSSIRPAGRRTTSTSRRRTCERSDQLAARRQAGADLRLASGELGTAGDVAAAYTASTLWYLYRRPNIAAVDERSVRQSRDGHHGHADRDRARCADRRSPMRWRRACHVGMLVDQYYVRGVDVTFFGRSTQGQSADCAARPPGRLPDPRHPRRAAARRDRFRVDLTDAIEPVRDADGKIDVAGTMQIDHVGGRRLGARASRAMAVAAPPLAVSANADAACRFSARS